MGAGVFPAVNITETTDNYFVRAELPGIKNDELQLDIKERTLTIAGNAKLKRNRVRPSITAGSVKPGNFPEPLHYRVKWIPGTLMPNSRKAC